MGAEKMPTNYRAVLLDIEGTTTSISFVYDVLFPFARAHVEEFLNGHWNEQDVQDVLDLLRAQVTEDTAAGVEDVPAIPEGPQGAAIAGAVENVHWQMVSDRKTTGLKTLQGMIWADGYVSGELQGHVFDDVPGALEAWTRAEIPIYIYSSGSVAAQKLLFRHSVAGDLTPHLRGYFDTTTGPKRESASYTSIATSIAVAPPDILFVTDVLPEAEAARKAGMRAVLSIRPRNVKIPFEHAFARIQSLSPLVEAL